MDSQPWFRFYEPHVPEHIDYPDWTMPRVLQRVAQTYPYRTATLFKGARLAYGDLNRAVNRLAAAWQRLGVRPGDRVALHLPNCPQYLIAYYATLRVGALVVPCNPLYQAQEMRHQLNDSGASVLVTLSSFYPLIRKIRPETKLRHVVVAQIKSYFKPATRALFTLFMERAHGHWVDISADERTDWFTDLLARAPARPDPVDVRPEDLAVLMYTGGTTGVSKGAELTHRNIFANAYQCRVWLNAAEAQETTLIQVPLFHCYGMTTGMNLGVLIAGTLLLIPDPRDLQDVVHSIVRWKPTLYPGVPAMYNAINNLPGIERYSLRSIKACISGAAGLPGEVQARFQALTGARLVEGYGLSEASPVTHANPIFGENRLGTIGLPWPDTEVKLVDVESGEHRVAAGEPGELCVRGPQVMRGYWNMPTETANVLRSDAAGGRPWLHTGDIAVMDEAGYFKIVDRKKDMILGAGGYNVYPREIEDLFYRHPKVLEAAAIGIPLEDKGERVKVFVVLKPGETAAEDELLAFCRANLAPYKVPKSVEFRDALPKTAVGKILRRTLVAEERARGAAGPDPERA